MKDPIKVGPPTSHRLLVVLCVDKSGNHTLSTLLGDVPLDFRYGSAIESVVSESHRMCIPGLTHLVNSSIASRTD